MSGDDSNIKSRTRAIFSANYSQNIEREDLFGFIRTTMWTAAMYPLPLEKYFPRFLRFIPILIDAIFEAFLYIVCIHIAILYGCTLYFAFGEGNLEFIVNCMIQFIIYCWTIIMKVYFRRTRPSALHDLITSINEEYRTCSENGFTYVTMKQSLAMSNKWIKVYVYCCFGGTIFWLILPIAYGDRSLPLACWYPFDYKAPLIYEAMYILQSIGQIQVAAAFSASSGFHMVLAILLSGQYDVLYCSLKNIVATAYMNQAAQEADLIDLKEKQKISDLELNQYYCSDEENTNENGWFQHLVKDTQNKPETFLPAFKAAFRNCVIHHRFILQTLDKMEKFYNSIWLFKTGEVIFLMCLVAFVSVKSTSANSSFMKIVSLMQYLILVVWELLIICYFGEMISQNSERCGEALLRSPWYLHMREMRQDFLFFLLNSQRPFRLSAGKMYSLDINRFRGVITTAFSFLTLLQKMDQRD